MEDIINKVLTKHNLEEKYSIMNAGFNRLVCDIDNKYILKICINPNKEQGVENEINFFQKNQTPYFPKLIYSDDTKTVIPYIYTFEEKIHGKVLFEIWDYISQTDREEILKQLTKILKTIHIEEQYNCLNLIDTFNRYLDQCIKKNIFTKKEISYLLEVEKMMKQYLINAKTGYIHGDIHFNNILLDEDGLKIIDFECYGLSVIDKEFDSINRMIINPKSFIKDEVKDFDYIPENYQMILPKFKEYYSEICNAKYFDERLILYNAINSLKWIKTFPDHEHYRKVLFKDTKTLIN